MNRLISKAKSLKRKRSYRRNYTKDEIELCIAWLKDEIGSSQLAHGLEIENSGNIYVNISCILASGVRQGFIKLITKQSTFLWNEVMKTVTIDGEQYVRIDDIADGIGSLDIMLRNKSEISKLKSNEK